MAKTSHMITPSCIGGYSAGGFKEEKRWKHGISERMTANVDFVPDITEKLLMVDGQCLFSVFRFHLAVIKRITQQSQV